MAIRTADRASPLSAFEPLLIIAVALTFVVNLVLSALTHKLGRPEWLEAVHFGLYCGQCLLAITLAGLMGRSWLGAFAVVLAAATLCFNLPTNLGLERWDVDDFSVIIFTSPLLLLVAAAPTMALRQLLGLRIAAESDESWSRRPLAVGDVLVAIALLGAALVLVRVGILFAFNDRNDFWGGLCFASLLGIAMGALIVVPTLWCVFVFESRRGSLIGLSILTALPSLITAVTLFVVRSETLGIADKLYGIALAFIVSVAAAGYFLTALVLLRRRGYRLLRAALSRVEERPARFRHASRWIVAAVVAVAAIVNFYVSPIEEARERTLAFERWVREAEGRLQSNDDGGFALRLTGTDIDDGELAVLRDAPEITSLDLTGTDLTDADLEHIAQLGSLKVLTLDGTAISDRGLLHLRHLSQLYSLSLRKTSVTGSALAEFDARDKLRTVNLSDAAVTDEGCRGIGDLKTLQELDLGNTSITDVGLSCLAKLTSLQSLKLRGISCDGSGFRDFKPMPNLFEVHLTDSRCGDGLATLVSNAPVLAALYLERTAVTDALLPSLRGHTFLNELELSGTAVNDRGLNELQTLPNLVVLGLDETNVTGSGFRNLTARRLTELRLRATRFADESLAHLNRFPRLYEIHLNDTPLSDESLSHLAGRSFSELNLAGTRVTAKGLLNAHFGAFKLTVDDGQATDAELSALWQMYESVDVVLKGKGEPGTVANP